MNTKWTYNNWTHEELPFCDQKKKKKPKESLKKNPTKRANNQNIGKN